MPALCFAEPVDPSTSDRLRFEPKARARPRRGLGSFVRDERGEIAPASYLLTLPLALGFIFFALDLGLRKGAQIGVEYAAFCAARAAAVNYRVTPGSACDSTAAAQAATRAAAACMAAFVSKRGVPDPTLSGALLPLIDRAQKQVTVTLQGGCSAQNGVVTAVVQYRYLLQMPMSPLSTGSQSATLMTASAQHLIY
jgi:hypothetical protein